MKFQVKTNGNCGKPGGISIEVDGEPITYFIGAMDIRLRPNGVKIVVDEMRLTNPGIERTTRTFYVNGDSTIELEMGEVDEKSTISEDA